MKIIELSTAEMNLIKESYEKYVKQFTMVNSVNFGCIMDLITKSQRIDNLEQLRVVLDLLIASKKEYEEEYETRITTESKFDSDKLQHYYDTTKLIKELLLFMEKVKEDGEKKIYKRQMKV